MKEGLLAMLYMNYILGWRTIAPCLLTDMLGIHECHTFDEKVCVFQGIYWGKVGGMDWEAVGLPPWGRGDRLPFHTSDFPQEIPWKAHTFLTLVNKNIILCCRPAIPSLRFSLRKSLGKPTPSWHWLIRISFYVWLEWQIVWIFSVIFSVARMIFSVARIIFSVVRIIFSSVKNDF